MSKKLKVYGITHFIGGEQKRVVAAVPSRKRFAELLGISLYHAEGYASETYNEHELKAALAEPGHVFYAVEPYQSVYLKFK